MERVSCIFMINGAFNFCSASGHQKVRAGPARQGSTVVIHGRVRTSSTPSLRPPLFFSIASVAYLAFEKGYAITNFYVYFRIIYIFYLVICS